MKSLSKNSIFYLIYTIVNVLFPFITGIYVSHVLFEGTIGEFEAARNFAQYFVTFAFLGIPTYGLRQIARARNNKEELNHVYSELLVINFISTLFFLIIYIILICSFPGYFTNKPLYLIMGGLVFLNIFNNTWLFEGLEEFSFICVRNLIFKILCFVLLVVFVRKDSDYLLYGMIAVIGVAGNYLLNLFRSKKYACFTLKNLNLKRHIKPILFLFAVNIAIEIYTLFDISMLKLFADNESVAFYSYGSKIHKIIINVINAFTIVVVPRLSFYYKQKDNEHYNQLLTKTLNVILLLAIPCIIGLYFTSDSLITTIYGSGYIRSAGVLKILSLVFVISPVGYLLGSRVLLTVGKEKIMIIPVASGALTNLILNFLLIPLYKEIGASIASVVGEFVVAFVYILISKKYFRLKKCVLNIYRILISSFTMLLALEFIKVSSPPSFSTAIKEVIVAPSIYFLMLSVLQETNVKSYSTVLIKKFFG